MNKLLQKSIENIRLSQIQAKVNLEAEILWAKTSASTLPQNQQRNYLLETGHNYLKSKIKYLF